MWRCGPPPHARPSALLLLPLLSEPRIPGSNQPVPLVHVGGLGFAVKGVLHHSLQAAGVEPGAPRQGRGQRTAAARPEVPHKSCMASGCVWLGWGQALARGSRGCSLLFPALPRTCSPPMAEMNPAMSTKGTHASTQGAIISTGEVGKADSTPACPQRQETG